MHKQIPIKSITQVPINLHYHQAAHRTRPDDRTIDQYIIH